MQVIATAGHVDHGKSTLVRALTGMEPDRWAEERRRGMTIDLGYAWMRLPGGEELAFVDVPGHERFATNMLAGVGPAPAVLLVIAADQGWAAQTEDHVRALSALDVRHGVVAVTRSDLADPGPAIREAAGRLRGTSLEGIQAVPVSGITGDGLSGLVVALKGLAGRLPAADPKARVRLWLDRCFTIRGSGTVVTGTLRSGTLRRGDRLELGGREVTVRALQQLGRPAEEVAATARVALNLRGISATDVHRGDVMLTSSAWRLTPLVDVRTEGGELPGRAIVHIGSAAVPARVRSLGPGGAARLSLAAALPLAVGDRALLRDPGRRAVLTGITVLDPAPPPLTRRGAARARDVALADDHGTPDLAREMARRGAAPRTLLDAIGVPVPDPPPESVVAVGGWLIATWRWRAWRAQLSQAVEGDGTALLDAGVAADELVRRLGLPTARVLSELVADQPDLEQVRGQVRRRGATVALRSDLAAALARLGESLRDQPFMAPEQSVLTKLGLGRRELGAAAAAGAILRLPGDVILLPDAPRLATDRLRTVAQPFTLSQARQALGTTRRVAVPLLEHLDGIRVTERVSGELRRLRA